MHHAHRLDARVACRRAASSRSPPDRRRGASRSAMNSTSRPSFAAIFCHSVAKWPVSYISTRSPRRERVARAPLPTRRCRRRGRSPPAPCVLLNTRFMPARHFLADAAGTRGRGGRSSGNRSRAARGRARWSVPGSAGSGGRRDVGHDARSLRLFVTTPPMNAPLHPGQVCRGPASSAPRARACASELDGEVLFDAASRGRYSTDASIYQIEPIGVVVPRSEEAARAAIAHRGRGGRPDPAARRGHLAVRPDGRRGAGHRPHQVPQPRAARSTRKAGAPWSQPGVVLDHAERAAAQARPVVPGRRLDQRAGDDRRHGGQQLLRLALDRLRQHGAQRARDRRVHGRRASAGASAPMRRARCRASTASSSQKLARAVRAREATEIEARFPKVLRSRRLQPRPPRPAARQRRASARRLAKARSRIRSAST